ncbi:MAG: MFS transporter [Candidatus Devosia phytovorans]|uniref:MFS transporter n=1 Tax=Candidatus Devosia phytovorans TaxID=3121372 RepID=A0AAJ5VQX2_9HYPH|nr:MFS transporter [Devosia sp.]WEK03103.1 MAG: MFS transporter [Devosia sp.]
MDSATSRRRFALFVFFFLPGVALASWVTRTPAIRDALGASIGEMGLVLFGVSVGSMTGILNSGWLVGRFGTRPIALVSMLIVMLALTVMAGGVVLASAWLVAFSLFLFGLGMGMSEIAINVDGADVERISGQHVLHTLHGCFSLGTVAGALLGMLATAINFPVAFHLVAIAVIAVPCLFYFVRDIPFGIGIEARAVGGGAPIDRGPAVWKDPRVILIGIVVLAMALAEGAANDWLPLLMVDEYGFSATSGSLVFLGFASAMTLGRFAGGWFLARFGRVAVIRGSAVIGAIGLCFVIFAHNPILAGAAVILWGLGASLGFPVAISAAGDSGPNPAARVRIVAMVGYVAFLVGPPLLGFVGEEFGLRNAMLIVLGLVGLAALLASAMQGKAIQGEAEPAKG